MSTTTAPTSIAFDELKLDDARALLEHAALAALPSPQDDPLGHLQGLVDNLCELSLRDPLTGLANRRHFRAVLEKEIDVVARSGESALLLMLDIDHFKKINDTHGHAAGDLVLQAVARTLSACIRPMDTVARYGGEEFAIVLPVCPVSFGETIAERIRATVEGLSIPISPQLSLSVTISIGGAYAPEWVRSTTGLWTERADVQLYRAKAEGRNRVCLDHQQVIAVSAEEKSLLFGHLSLGGEAAWADNAAADPASGTTHRVN